MTRNLKVGFSVGTALVALSMIAYADGLQGHPHLKAAHNKIEKAVGDLEAANDGKTQFGGHREKAEDLLRQAQQEIEQAAQFANQNGKK